MKEEKWKKYGWKKPARHTLHTHSIHVPTVKMAERNEMQNHSEEGQENLLKSITCTKSTVGKTLLWNEHYSNYFHRKKPCDETNFECAGLLTGEKDVFACTKQAKVSHVVIVVLLELLLLTFIWTKGESFLLKSVAMDRRHHSTFVRYLFLSVAFLSWCNGNTEFFGIGAMLSSPEYEKIFEDAVGKINDNSSGLLRTTKLNGSSYVLSTNPIRSALDVCENLISKGVGTVIVSHPKDEFSPPISVSYACSFYHIPVIGISARETIFSDKVRRV